MAIAHPTAVMTVEAFAAAVLCLTFLGTFAFGAEIWVSPAGDDAGPGTRAQPLKTFAAAREAVRRLKATASALLWARL